MEKTRLKDGLDDPSRTIVLALAGNPNSGKTTIFNAITGARQHVGNYAGVTVERREGVAVFKGRRLRIIDLPGTYSLTAHSPDEVVARETLITERPDAVIQIVDAGNLERNLYLTVQLLEMKAPLVLAFNMMDEVEKKGLKISRDQLAELLGAPIVATVGSREEGIADLLTGAVEVARTGRRPEVEVRYGTELDRSVDAILAALDGGGWVHDPRWLAIKLLEADAEVEKWVGNAGADSALTAAAKERERVAGLLGDDAEILMADARYGWVHGALAETVSLTVAARRSLTDKVDTVLANRVLGLPIFLFFMWLTFAATFTLGKPLTRLVEYGAKMLGQAAAALVPAGSPQLESLLVDGVIGGVGGVLVFLPNIVILFMMVALMEDSGYMARAAFIVDKVMHLVGLHGKSFIPMFIGFGCNVPAIMAARVLENRRDRITTIMVTPFMSCSARLPIYVLFAGAFFPARRAGTVVFSLYLLGIVVAMGMARLLRTYVVKGPPTPFVMELPPYRMPTLKSVLLHMWQRAWMYLKKAGTIILGFSIVIWFLSSYPRQVDYSPETQHQLAAERADGRGPELSDGLRARMEKERLAASYAGRYGRVMAKAFAPIGLDDWKIGVALTTGFAAKEIVISTLGTLYSLGEVANPEISVADLILPPSDDKTANGLVGEMNGKPGMLSDRLARDDFFTPLRAYTLMVFVLLYIPCLATVTVAWRELGSWKWAALMVGMNLAVAYSVAGAVYWIGTFLRLGTGG